MVYGTMISMSSYKKVMTFCLFKYGTYIYVVYENTSIISQVEAYIVGSYFLVTGCIFWFFIFFYLMNSKSSTYVYDMIKIWMHDFLNRWYPMAEWSFSDTLHWMPVSLDQLTEIFIPIMVILRPFDWFWSTVFFPQPIKSQFLKRKMPISPTN